MEEMNLYNGGLTPEMLAEVRKRRMELEGSEPAAEEKHIKTWRDEIISLKGEYTDPIPVLVRGDDEIVQLGDIQMIEGHSGSKKTFLVSAMMAGALGASPDNSLGFELCSGRLPEGADGKVLYIDTEQNPANTYKVKKRVHILAALDENEDNDKFIVINQRGDTTDERLKFALEAIREVRPTICFIDNLKDFSGDFNDQKSSYDLVLRMMRVSAEYRCAIVCVIHQNFGGDKARGHLGSALYEKVSMCLTLAVDDPTGESITRVSMAKKPRGKMPEDFAFIIDDNGLPRLTTPPVKSAKSDDVRKFLEEVMQPNEIVKAGELRKRLMDKTGCKDRAASSMLDTGIREGILAHYGWRRDSRYQLKPKTSTEEADGHDNELPF